MLNYNDISLDIQTQSGKISQQPTANSQQPTANSQQPTALLSKVISNILIIHLMKQSGFGFFPIALFLCLFGASTGVLDVY